jgi:hypothetical protein
MVKAEKVKTHVIFPSELLEEIDKAVGGRKRSGFIVKAAREKLEELKFQRAMETAAGSWREENHPDLKTQEDIRAYLHKTRELTEKRTKRFGG